jgi:hypothetical protein
MMRRRCNLVVLAVLAPVVMGAAPGPVEVTVADLLGDPGAYAVPQVALVVVEGELVGDFGRRDDGTVWTQLNGDAYAGAPLLGGGSLAGYNQGIGVRIPAAVWPGLDRPGGYRVRGPVVALTGVWRFHDPARGGESYLDVTALELLQAPLALEEGVRWVPLALGAGLLGAGLALGLATRRRD